MIYRDRKGLEYPLDTKLDRIWEKGMKSIWGRMGLKILAAPFISKVVGVYMSSFLSRPLIRSFIKANNIDKSELVKEKFTSYNDIFTRKFKEGIRPVNMSPEVFISPCDGKVMAFPISDETVIRVKSSDYTVASLVQDEDLARKYAGGLCIIIRLSVDDYHRYCFVDDCDVESRKFIKGHLYTVNPYVTEKILVYKENCREYTRLHTLNFGDIIHMEVGASMVGKIKNHICESAARGEEKGYFQFGGSTVIILTEKDRVRMDSDILQNTRDGIETLVRLGEQIGIKGDIH